MISNTNSEPTICFVVPPSRMHLDMVPIQYLFLAGWLKVNGYKNVYIVDTNAKNYRSKIKGGSEIRLDVQKKAAQQVAQFEKFEFQRIVGELKEYRPDYVGLSCFTANYNETMRLSREIKSHLNTKIIVGGIHAVLRPVDFLLKDSSVDIVVTGEGERPLLEIMKSNGDIDGYLNINGIAFRHNGQIRINPKSEIVDYSLLGPLPYEMIDNMDWYCRVAIGMIRYIPTSGCFFMTSRGCPYNCTFCAAGRQKVKFRPLKHVVDEIEYVKKEHHIDSFYILDDTFCIGQNGQERVIEFCDLLADRKLKMTWAMQIRPNQVSDKLLKAIKKSGCLQLDFGVESLSQRLLDLVQKQVRVGDIEKAFDLCKKYNIRTFANLMVNFPEETEEDIQMTVDFIKRKKPTVPSIVITVPYIGTKLYEDYVLKRRSDIGIGEYYIYEDLEIYYSLKYDFFKLCKHNLDLAEIVNYINLKYYRIFDFCFSRYYLKTIFRSKRKKEYLIKILNIFLKPQYWLSFEGVSNLFKKIRLKLKNFEVS